jgi:CBS domain-containing protein
VASPDGATGTRAAPWPGVTLVWTNEAVEVEDRESEATMTYARTVRPVRPGDKVNALMSWPVAVVEATDSLPQVAQALCGNVIGAVLVLRDGDLVGVVSERDLAADAAAPHDDHRRLTAADVMSRHLVTVPPDAPLVEAARIMREAHVRHLPVVSDGLIAGMLSMRDLFEVLLQETEDPR